MFPLNDSTPRNSFPFINYLIIALNVFVFFIEITSPDFEALLLQWSFIPSQFSFLDLHSYTFIFSSIFIHGSIMHILSNMWFLRIFGDNVEDAMGHVPYLLFYLAAGFVATMAQYSLSPVSTLPILGASGAISGVAGAYFVWYKRSSILTFIPPFIIFGLPVWFFLGYWFFTQLFNGIGSLVSFDMNNGGIAWFAHLGGFVFGYIIAKSISPRKVVLNP